MYVLWSNQKYQCEYTLIYSNVLCVKNTFEELKLFFEVFRKEFCDKSTNKYLTEQIMDETLSRSNDYNFYYYKCEGDANKPIYLFKFLIVEQCPAYSPNIYYYYISNDIEDCLDVAEGYFVCESLSTSDEDIIEMKTKLKMETTYEIPNPNGFECHLYLNIFNSKFI